MKSKKELNRKIAAGASALLVAAGIMGSGMYVSAYGGDPNVKAPWYSEDRHVAIQDAVTKNDYNAWKNLKTEQMNARMNWMFSKITQDNFPKFAEVHNLMQQGKYDEANKIREELGLPLRHGRGQGRGVGLNK
ncbi:MAG: hypothetical protein WAV31_00010 [Candidatus Moraniibacteriota bacterium]